ncbi:MAG: carbohydrate ABC transporter permease [Lachnospiraceae bacterium]|nr:carbohydrate ABC transporter permease [Lachnospiraceae bacterium]
MKSFKKFIRSDKFFQTVISVILCVFAVTQLYPLIYVVSASLSAPSAVSSGKLVLFPVDFTLEGYEYILQHKDIWIGYGNTILYTVLGTIVNLIVTLTCAYALSREEVEGKKILMIFFMITMYISGGLIPEYLNVKSLGLLNTRTYMIIGGALSVYNMIVARTFFVNSIPNEIIEAAKIDGCSDFGTFLKIVLPLSKACVAVQILYYGVARWNAYFNAMIYLDDRDKYPLQMFLREILIQSKISMDAAMAMTAEEAKLMAEMAERADLMKYCVIVVSTLPMMIIYPKLQKFFEKGVMIGGVKG